MAGGGGKIFFWEIVQTRGAEFHVSKVRAHISWILKWLDEVNSDSKLQEIYDKTLTQKN